MKSRLFLCTSHDRILKRTLSSSTYQEAQAFKSARRVILNIKQLLNANKSEDQLWADVDIFYQAGLSVEKFVDEGKAISEEAQRYRAQAIQEYIITSLTDTMRPQHERS